LSSALKRNHRGANSLSPNSQLNVDLQANTHSFSEDQTLAKCIPAAQVNGSKYGLLLSHKLFEALLQALSKQRCNSALEIEQI
jgi:hypothetical protein